MWGSKDREIARLKLRIEALAERYDDARQVAGIHLGNLTRMAQRFATQHDELARLRKEQSADTRLTRALKACARYRRDIADRDRLILDQQKTLDCLLGLDSAAVEAGADWQNRRTDRPAVSS